MNEKEQDKKEDEFCWCKMCCNKHSEVMPNMAVHWSIESRISKSLGYIHTLFDSQNDVLFFKFFTINSESWKPPPFFLLLQQHILNKCQNTIFHPLTDFLLHRIAISISSAWLLSVSLMLASMTLPISSADNLGFR